MNAREASRVKTFWENASCGEDLYLDGIQAADYERQSEERYRLEPYIPGFAGFECYRDRNVLEIGVGVGADHERFAAAGASMTGIDLTERAIRHLARRLELRGLESDLRVGDAERLVFPDQSFDLVYSWGVLHHIAGDTAVAFREIRRVLKPGGEVKLMIYHRHSFVGYMLWLRYALARGRPRTSLTEIYARHLESSGTRAYTKSEVRTLFDGFEVEQIETRLTHADLLTSPVGQQHRGLALDIARRIWPRWLIRRFFSSHGLFLLVHARKPVR